MFGSLLSKWQLQVGLFDLAEIHKSVGKYTCMKWIKEYLLLFVKCLKFGNKMIADTEVKVSRYVCSSSALNIFFSCSHIVRILKSLRPI